MATLYRSYRPQKWDEVVNQVHIKTTISQEIAAGRTAQAYLFTGPRGVGKTTVARVLAKSLNCETRKSPAYEPCNECTSCRDITQGKSFDVLEVDAASQTGVDNVRENIIAATRTSAPAGHYKVFIIDEVHMLSTAAFNALLKTLEEPPANVVFVLCTTEVHKIPATIISRCERFDFKRIGVGEMIKKLEYIAKQEGLTIEKAILEAVARYSEGHMRDAESLLGQLVAIGGKEITREEADLVIPRSDLGEAIKLLGFLAAKDAASSIALVNRLLDEGLDIKRFIADFLELGRKVMMSKISPSLATKFSQELGETMELELNKAAAGLTTERTIAILEAMIRARNEIGTAHIAQLPLEIALAELCLAPSTPGPSFSGGGAQQRQNTPSPSTHQTIKSATPPPAGTVNKDYIESKWNEVLAKIKQHNHSLSLILRVCKPKEVSGNQVCLAFRYKFHKDRISEIQIKTLVEKIMNEVYGQPLLIEAIVDEGLSIDTNGNGNGYPPVSPVPPVPNGAEGSGAEGPVAGNQDKNMLDNLLKTFGGKVVQ